MTTSDLSRSELEVLGLLHQGCTDKELACELHLSLAAAKARVRRLARKANVRGRIGILHHFRPQNLRALPTLPTVRANAVAALVLRGHSNQQVANVLGITVNGVRHDLCALFDFAGVWSRAELMARYGFEEGPECEQRADPAGRSSL